MALLSPTGNAATIEEIVVTGNRNVLNQDLALASSAIALDREDAISLDRSVADWLDKLPGVSLNGQGGLLQSYSVRGFSRWRIRTELDGVPILTDRRAGNAVSFLPPGLLGEVEVERGPGSTIYGSDAMGGVVELRTARPESLTLSSAWQSNDQAWSLTGSAPVSHGVWVAAAHRSANRARTPGDQPLNSGYRQSAAQLGIAKQWHDIDVDISLLGSRGRDIGKSANTFPETVIADYPEDDHELARIELRSGTDWMARLYHHGQDWTARTARIGSRENQTRYQSQTHGGLLYAATGTLAGTGRVGAEWLGRRGVDIRDLEISATQPQGETTQLIDGEQDSVGLFVDQQWEVSDWRLGVGGRWDHVDQRNQERRRNAQRTSANVGVDWLPSLGWRLSMRLGTGFRFPTLSELYFNGTTPRGDTLGNPLLRPELSRGIEFEAAWSGDQTELRLTGYRSRMRNYIERYRASPTLRSFRNTDNAEINGLEAQFAWRSGLRWRHELSYQWQQGEDERGRWLADLNPPSLRYFLSWRGEDVEAATDIRWQRARQEAGPDEQALDEAAILNGRLTWRPTPALQTELFANNLFNETYFGSADDEAALQPGRTLGVRLVWQR